MPRRVSCVLAGTMMLLGTSAAGEESEVGWTTERQVRILDDLVGSGLGLAGMRGPPPGVADPQSPTPEELRRLALHTNYRGLIDVTEGSGFGERFGMLQPVAGTEILAWRHIPELQFPHAVALLIPDGFPGASPCLVVVAASATRGIYGGAGIAGDWALQRGCAVAYTDKAAGTGFFDGDSREGVSLTGELTADPEGFQPAPDTNWTPHRIAVKHAHSGDNPEAYWGNLVLDAARFGEAELRDRFGDLGNLRIVAAGISNGGGAVLRAAEVDRDGILDAVVAGEPNLFVPESEAQVAAPEGTFHARDARPFIDYATWSGLYQPCAAIAETRAEDPFSEQLAALHEALAAHCGALREAGLLQADTLDAQAIEAGNALDDLLLTDSARRLSAMNVVADIWLQTTATMAHALARRSVDDPVCGIGFAAVGEDGRTRPSTPEERALWFGTSTGMPPTAGIVHIDRHGRALGAGSEMARAFQCWRGLWEPGDPVVQGSVAAIRSTADLPSIPIVIVHGRADALIPVNHTSRPYAAAARHRGHEQVYYYEIENAQHVDAVLADVGVRDTLVWMQPYYWDALHRVFEHLETGAPLPPNQVVRTDPVNERPTGMLADTPDSADQIVFADGTLSVPH